MDKVYPDYPKVAARVISRDGNNWFHVFTIDKGKKDGIQVDMNVIAGNGLVGIVSEVGESYAKVLICRSAKAVFISLMIRVM